MKITIMLHNRTPFVNTRTFEDFEYNGDNYIHLVLDLFGDDVTDVYIYQYGTNIDNYKKNADYSFANIVHEILNN